jgi:hypothetical protein
MRKGVSPFVATLILTSLSIVILGDVIKLQLNETIPIGKQILRFITNTGRLWKQEFFVPNNWVLSDWSERKGIVIDNTHSLELKNYQISVDPNLTITDGLVFHAHMGDEGNLVVDYSGNNNDGKLYGNTRALFKFDEGLDNKTYDSSSYANNGNFYGGNDGTYYGNNPHTQSNSTVLQLTGSSPINLTHSFYLPSKAILSDVNLTVYYINNTANLGYNTINVYVNGRYIGSFNDSGETSTTSYTFVNILKGNFTAGVLNNITYEGNVTNITQSTLKYVQDIGWTDGKFGKALSFDGIDDYVLIPKSASLDITEKITLTVWFKLHELPSVAGHRMDIYSMSGGGITVYVDTDNKLHFDVNIGGTWYVLASPTVLSKDVWYYVTGVYDQTKQKIYINGVLDTETSRTGLLTISPYDRALGRHPVSNVYYFKGIIDEVRIYNRALSEEEIKAHYQAGSDFNTTLNDTGLVLYLRFNEGSGTLVKDDSMWRINPNNCISNSCLNFDGSNDYVKVPDSASISITKSLSLSAWINKQAETTQEIPLTPLKLNSYGLTYNKTHLIAHVFNTTAGWCNLSVSYTLENNTWYFVTQNFDFDNNGNISVYVNGNLIGSKSCGANFLIEDNSNPLLIGRGWSESGNLLFNGKIDEVAIYSKALSEEEIKALYEAKKAKFVEYKQGKFGKALSFDGIDDYVRVSNNPTLNPLTITISMWMKLAQLPSQSSYNYINLIFKEDYTAQTGYELYFVKSTNSLTFGCGNGTSIPTFGFGKTDWEINRWYHIALTLDSSSFKAYVDGQNIRTAAGTTIAPSPTRDLFIGSFFGSQYFFNGLIDEVRIYNRALTGPSTNCSAEPNNEICALYLSKTSLEDLRFTDREGNLLPYYHESDNRIWIKTDIPANSTKVIYMYYGNNQAGTLSNFNEVFPGLVAYYTFDEGSGSKAYDTTPYNNHGTIYGATWVDGVIGKALSFDGVDDYVEVPDSTNLRGFSNLTILMWVKIPSGTGYWGFVSKTERSNGWQFIKNYPTRPIFFEIFEGGSNIGSYAYSYSQIPENTWTQIGIVVEGLTWKFIINGTVDRVFTSSRALTHSTVSLWIGSSRASTPYLNGTIDEVRIYNRALSADEIAQHFATPPLTIIGPEE